MQGFEFTSGGPPEDPILQALSAGMAEYRNESIRLFSKLVKLGQGIHLPHLLVDEMRAMAQDAGANGGVYGPPQLLSQCIQTAKALFATCMVPQVRRQVAKHCLWQITLARYNATYAARDGEGYVCAQHHTICCASQSFPSSATPLMSVYQECLVVSICMPDN